jgi:primosomal protein N'
MIAQIIIAKRGPLRLAILDYLVPPELEDKIVVGQLITAPLRNQETFGVVRRLSSAPATEAKLKMLKSIVIEPALLSEGQLAFLDEVSTLYHVSLGFILKNNLLPLQKRKLKKLADETIILPPVHKHTAKKPRAYVYRDIAERKEYLQNTIAEEGQTLIIVPEVGDIDRVKNYFTPKQQEQTITVQGSMGDKEMFTAWVAVWRQTAKIIIGTRTALFFPWHNLATIIVDNEGSESHKSWDMSPRLHSREAALMMSKFHGATVHLIGPALSVETRYFAEHKIYELVENTSEIKEREGFVIAIMKNERRGGNLSFLSEDTQAGLKQPGTVFLFCHRRGTVSCVSCRDCGTVVACPKCERPLTYHAVEGMMLCHTDNHHERMQPSCKQCGGMNIALLGAGTDRIRSEVKKLFPDDPRPIIVLDQDMLTAPNVPAEDCIIIGTHLAWGFVPWERVTLMTFIDTDTPLFIPEYRLAERVFLQLHDARRRLPTTTPLIIQTDHPDHPALQGLHDPEAFYNAEKTGRRIFGYPPYKYLLKVIINGLTGPVVQHDIKLLYPRLKKLTEGLENCSISSPFTLSGSSATGTVPTAILFKLSYKNYKKSWRLIVENLPDYWKVDPNPLTISTL